MSAREGYGAEVAQKLFVFIQLEFPWALGPPDGRYLMREREQGDPEKVVVLGTLQVGDSAAAGAERRNPLRRALSSRPRPAAPDPDPARVTTTRVTVIDPVPLSAEQQARAWLADLDGERDVLAAVAVINRVLHYHRIAAADPYTREVSPAQALVIRAGWGEGEQVAAGRWLDASELPWRPRGTSARSRGLGGRSRSSALRPQERFAALLGARAGMLQCEELALRARLDLDHGRLGHAAIELDNAIASAVVELRAEGRHDLAIRVAELEQLQAGVSAQARAARPPSSAEPDEDALAHALGRLEAALRARTAAGVTLK
jgi:hypothetical protein